MAAFAAKSAITLTPTLARDATKTINAFPELTRLETRIQAYIPVGPHGSKPELNALRQIYSAGLHPSGGSL